MMISGSMISGLEARKSRLKTTHFWIIRNVVRASNLWSLKWNLKSSPEDENNCLLFYLFQTSVGLFLRISCNVCGSNSFFSPKSSLLCAHPTSYSFSSLKISKLKWKQDKQESTEGHHTQILNPGQDKAPSIRWWWYK